MTRKAKEFKINVKDLVLNKVNDKKRGTWKFRITQEMYWRKDQVIQAVKINTSNGYLEWPIQLLYPLELNCNNDGNINKSRDQERIEVSNENNGIKININVTEFKLTRSVAASVLVKIKDVWEMNQIATNKTFDILISKCQMGGGSGAMWWTIEYILFEKNTHLKLVKPDKLVKHVKTDEHVNEVW